MVDLNNKLNNDVKEIKNDCLESFDKKYVESLEGKRTPKTVVEHMARKLYVDFMTKMSLLTVPFKISSQKVLNKINEINFDFENGIIPQENELSTELRQIELLHLLRDSIIEDTEIKNSKKSSDVLNYLYFKNHKDEMER